MRRGHPQIANSVLLVVWQRVILSSNICSSLGSEVAHVSGLLSAIDELAATDLNAMADCERGATLRELYLARTRLDAEINRQLQVFDARGLSESDGAPSTQSWLRGLCRLAPNEAASEVHTARGLRDFPLVATAWLAGDLGRQHARAVTMLAKETSVEDVQAAEAALVDAARRVDPLRFAGELRAWREALRRSKGDTPDESSIESRRELTLASSLDTMLAMKGWLTPEVGELARTVLDPLAAPLPGDTRTAAHRYHDALAEVFRRVLGADAVAPGHKVRPSLLVLCSAEGLLDAERAAAAELGYGNVVGNDVLQRIACDSTVTRVLIDAKGEVLDLGRSVRTVTLAQWKALVVRDGGCVVPGCDRPATWCDAHHLWWWTRGGPTDLKNLALVCGYHHSLVHEGGWTLGRDTSGRWTFLRPDGTCVHPDTANGTAIQARRGALRAVFSPPATSCPN
jgi:hypothetical protein